MKTLIAPNGMKIVYNDSDEREVQRIIKKAQEAFGAKIAKREEKQKEYFLRVRARYEAWEAKKAKAAATEAEETIDAVEPVEVEAEVVEDIEEAV
jgi:thymidylate kinase